MGCRWLFAARGRRRLLLLPEAQARRRPQRHDAGCGRRRHAGPRCRPTSARTAAVRRGCAAAGLDAAGGSGERQD
eukprot:6333145-Prymnesium_polylepis.1